LILALITSQASRAKKTGKRVNRKRGVISSGNLMRKTSLIIRVTRRETIRPRTIFPAEKDPVIKIQNTKRQQNATYSLE